MPLTLYYYPLSQPCRAVQITLYKLGLDFEEAVVNISEGEHKTPEFSKINPNQKIPTLDDGGFKLWESIAIMQYLARKCGSDLYPKGLKERFLVDRYLRKQAPPRVFLTLNQPTLPEWHVENTRKTFTEYIMGKFVGPEFFGSPPPQEEAETKMVSAIEKTLQALETIWLFHTEYVGGDDLTIADFALIPELQNLKIYAKWDLTVYPNVQKYFERMEKDDAVHKATQKMLALQKEIASTELTAEELALIEENEKIKAQLKLLEREKEYMTKAVDGIDVESTFHLYHYPGTRSTRVLFLAYELGVEPQIHSVTFKSIKKADYLAVNPNSLIPAAKFGDLPVFESGAIMRELLRRNEEPAQRLFPDSWTKENWTTHNLYEFWTITHIDEKIVSKLFGAGRVKNAFTGAVRKWFNNVVVPKMTTDLGLHDFINGPDFTATDVYVAYTLTLAEYAKILSDKALKDYLARIKERPAYKKAFEGISL